MKNQDKKKKPVKDNTTAKVGYKEVLSGPVYGLNSVGSA
jgi:hypothetical protein